MDEEDAFFYTPQEAIACEDNPRHSLSLIRRVAIYQETLLSCYDYSFFVISTPININVKFTFLGRSIT